ncbi:enoyl-CoA hydratase-related protein [Pseudochelatococcus sp. B33]
MTMTVCLDVSGDGIATLTLNRPERGNAFNQEMLDELGQGLSTLEGDECVRILVLRGNGKHFCTGADIAPRTGERDGGLTFNQVLSRLDRFAKTTIAVVEGGCVGGGLGFASCCDVLLATDNAFFMVPELRVGIAPSAEFTGLLIRAMGHRAFRRYGLSGERISPSEALRTGLVHQIIEPHETESELEKMTDAFLHGAPEATAQLKRTIATQSVPGEAILFPSEKPKPRGLERSPEAIEGLQALREKRKPSWYPR